MVTLASLVMPCTLSDRVLEDVARGVVVIFSLGPLHEGVLLHGRQRLKRLGHQVDRLLA